MQMHELRCLLSNYRDIFALKYEPLGRTGLVKHEIQIGTAKPIRQAPRRTPMHQVDMVEKTMEEMREAGVIKPSQSPWASPVVVVRKKDGGCRFCIDFRRLLKMRILCLGWKIVWTFWKDLLIIRL